MKRVWLIEIEGPKGKPRWRREVPYARFTRSQMSELLRLLTARAELSFDEIFDAADRKQPEPPAYLDVRSSQLGRVLRAGNGGAIKARLMYKEKDGQLKSPPYPHM